MLTLYHADTAVCAAKVRIVLAEKSIPWESRLLDFSRNQQVDPDYLKLNPNGVVPTLIHDGRVIIESTVINEYLDEAFAACPLRPAGAYGHALVRLWTKREDLIHDAINTVSTALLFRPEFITKSPENMAKRYQAIPDAARRAKFRELMDQGLASPLMSEAQTRFAKLFRDMERALAAGPWLVGAEFTLADAGLISYFFRLEVLEASAIWRDQFPGVADWYERCKLRPSFSLAVLDPVPKERLAHYRQIAAPFRPAIEAGFNAALSAL